MPTIPLFKLTSYFLSPWSHRSKTIDWGLSLKPFAAGFCCFCIILSVYLSSILFQLMLLLLIHGCVFSFEVIRRCSASPPRFSQIS